jgi:hypothetical protein
MLPPSSHLVNMADQTSSSAVKTVEGNKAAQFFGFEEAFTEVPDAVNGVVGKVRSLVLPVPSDCFVLTF